MKSTWRLLKLFGAVMAALLLAENSRLMLPFAQASTPPTERTLTQAGRVADRIGSSDAIPRLGYADLVWINSQSPSPSSDSSASDEKLYLPYQLALSPTRDTPSPSGATSPAPLNYNFDAPSYDDTSLVPNLTFEEDARTVGSEADGTWPANHDFSSGLANWTYLCSDPCITPSAQSGAPVNTSTGGGVTARNRLSASRSRRSHPV